VISPLAWARENAGVYLGNATAVRDFRIQLRGNRAAILWTVYLFILIGFGLVVYDSAAASGQVSVVDAQDKLRGFYQMVMALLATMVMLVAPALTSTAVVMERQRRSLDLLFSAPVSPKYFLVGKMISSYRYTWMLLILSLPVTAACVVLGGASWSDVLAAYILLSLHALVFTSIALLISTVAPKAVSAIIYSYLAAGAYVLGTSWTAGMLFAPRGLAGGAGMEAHFTVTLNPFLVVQSAGTYTTLWGVEVPNWVFMGLVALLISKLMLIGAASILSPYGAAETKSLRIHGLAYYLLISLGFTWSLASSASASLGTTVGVMAGMTVAWMVVLSSLLFAFVTCFGTDLERKFWPDGLFSWKHAIIGTPSGGLPYLLMLLGSAILGALLGVFLGAGRLPDSAFLAYALWTLGYIVLGWSLGRLASSFVSGLRASRTMHVAMMLVLFVLPAPMIAALDPHDGTEFPLWYVYPLYPLAGGVDKLLAASITGVVMFLVGLAVASVAEKWTKARFGDRRWVHE
jgi:hypothetical protein